MQTCATRKRLEHVQRLLDCGAADDDDDDDGIADEAEGVRLAILVHLYVAADHRRHGIGRRALQLVLERAWASGVSAVEVPLGSDSPPSHLAEEARPSHLAFTLGLHTWPSHSPPSHLAEEVRPPPGARATPTPMAEATTQPTEAAEAAAPVALAAPAAPAAEWAGAPRVGSAALRLLCGAGFVAHPPEASSSLSLANAIANAEEDYRSGQTEAQRSGSQQARRRRAMMRFRLEAPPLSHLRAANRDADGNDVA